MYIPSQPHALLVTVQLWEGGMDQGNEVETWNEHWRIECVEGDEDDNNDLKEERQWLSIAVEEWEGDYVRDDSLQGD